MTARRCAAFTWVQVLVALFVLTVLATVLAILARPAIIRERHPAELSHMRQLYTATFSMVMDGETTGSTNLTWPGSTDGTFASWSKSLVPEYLSTNEFCRLLSSTDFATDPRTLPTRNENAILVYGVTKEHNGHYVFLSTANFTNTPTGGLPPRADAKPFGNRGFIIIRSAGDGAVLRPRQAGDTNAVGLYAPLLR